MLKSDTESVDDSKYNSVCQPGGTQTTAIILVRGVGDPALLAIGPSAARQKGASRRAKARTVVDEQNMSATIHRYGKEMWESRCKRARIGDVQILLWCS